MWRIEAGGGGWGRRAAESGISCVVASLVDIGLAVHGGGEGQGAACSRAPWGWESDTARTENKPKKKKSPKLSVDYL